MDEMYKLIPEILPGQSNWTTKIIVAEKSVAKIGQNSPTKYQNIVLMDPQGNTVQATIYNNNITAFQDTLQPSKTYLISNAIVKQTKPEYRAISGDVQWTITGRTRIEEIPERLDALLSATYEFITFNNLQDYMDSNLEICIIGVAIDMRPKRQIQTYTGNQSSIQDIILLNERFEATVLRMWENFVDNECNSISNMLAKKPIIVGKHLKVSSFNGSLSISTKANSSIFIDPPFQQVEDFRLWIDQNIDSINDMVAKRSYIASLSSNLKAPPEDKLSKIKEIQELLLVQQYFWTKATIIVQVKKQSFWYMACSSCYKISSASLNEVYHCIYCKCQATAVPRARAYVQLKDSTGFINATIIGEPAERFLRCTATELMLQHQNNDSPQLLHDTTAESHLLYIKALNRDQSTDRMKYEIVFLLESISEHVLTEKTKFHSHEQSIPDIHENSSPKKDSNNPVPVKRALFGPTVDVESAQKQKQKIYTDDDNFVNESINDIPESSLHHL